MSVTFASPEWASALAAQLEQDAQVRPDSMTWVFGPIVFVVDADDEHGFDATGILLDLHEGSVRDVSAVEPSRWPRVPFAIGGSLARWRSVLAGELPILEGILQARLRSRGDLPTLQRHGGLLDGIIRAAAALDTSWPDEQPAEQDAAATGAACGR